MYGEEIIKEDIRSILYKHGFSINDFKIAVERSSSYAPHQIVASQVWVTIERHSVKKRYGIYRSNWPHDFEIDLKNGYYNH